MMTWHLQGLRFALVGLGSNFVLYLLYLFLTELGLGYKSAMTFLFAVGTLQTFLFNKRWTFAHRGGIQPTFFKYVAAYSIAYLLNLVALLLLVDRLGFPHQIVQGAMILFVGLMLFLAQRYWVFRAPAAT
jgi:putative flippase GtrA